MPWYADLHLHSHLSRATSKQLTLEHTALWARRKGIRLLGTADCVHPEWLARLRDELEPAEPGLFRLRPEVEARTAGQAPVACRDAPVRFMLTVEISNIYKRGGKVRKVHNVVCLPSFAAAERLQARLDVIGNIAADGRPILGLSSHDLLAMSLEADPEALFIPAHIWTPWFAVLGSMGGYDDLAECFGDLLPHVSALETGLSSDPPMNWRLSQLDRFPLVSHSDAHSPDAIGREATAYDGELSYAGVRRALHDPADRGLIGTVEFFPEEGKYHVDGHRACGVRWDPAETRAHGGRCPVCGKPVTVGVLARVEALADRPPGAPMPPRGRPFWSLVPLPEILGELLRVGPDSKAVQARYHELLGRLGGELDILRELPLPRIAAAGGELLAEAIRRMRAGQVHAEPGYDGVYGTVRCFSDAERQAFEGQTRLFSLPAPAPRAEPGAAPAPAADEAAPAAPAPALNPAQAAAVAHPGRRLLIVAGPGTGKTHTLARRILAQAAALPPGGRVLAITFTVKAAGELGERLHRLDPALARRVRATTVHGFCAGVLAEHGPDRAIAAEAERHAITAEAWPEADAATRRERLDRLSLLKNTGDGSAPLPAELAAYQERLAAAGLRDCDDLLVETVRLLASDPDLAERLRADWPCLAVDEYQDGNAIQQALLRALAGPATALTAIGDPDQAIYGFRGAEVGFFHRFAEAFAPAEVLRLAENYRCGGRILAASHAVMAAADAQRPALIARAAAPGAVQVVAAADAEDEARWIATRVEALIGGGSSRSVRADDRRTGFADVAVLARTRAILDPVAAALARAGLPTRIVGDRRFAERALVREAIAALALAAGGAVGVAEAAALTRAWAAGVGDAARDALLARLRGAGLRCDRAALAQAAGALPARAAAGAGALLAALERAAGASPAEALAACAALPALAKRLAEREDAAAWAVLARRALAVPDHAALAALLASASPDDALAVSADRIPLLTCHAAKGLEFDAVIVAGCEAGLMPLARDGCDPAEERRLFYVACTRARRELALCHAAVRDSAARHPSPFLADLGPGVERIDSGPRRERPVGRQLGIFDPG